MEVISANPGLKFFVEFVVTIIVYVILYMIGKFILKRLENNDSRFLNPKEYLPDEEIFSLKQVFYLIMMLILFIFMLYSLIFSGTETYAVAAMEIIIVLYIALTFDWGTWKKKILFLMIIPYGSLSFLLFGMSFVGFFDALHIIAYLYLMKIYYKKFKEYTETNSLGITIILLFALIFISFIVTTIVEGVGPLNAMVMVSNAFTSNGYTVLGTSGFGKLNSIFLVWGGYILSGVGTATLTAAILTRHFNKRFDELEMMIRDKEK